MALVFGLLNTKTVQNYAKGFIVQELKAKMNTDMGIGKLYFRPFNTVGLGDVYVNDRDNNKILVAQEVYATIDLFELMQKRVVISSTRLSNFDVFLAKEKSDTTLNIQFIIDAFKSQDDRPKAKLELKINAINIEDGNIYYDVHDKRFVSGKFDPNHISITDFNAKLALKSLQSDSLNIQIRRFSLKEKSGFNISNLVGRLVSKDNNYALKGFQLHLPDSKIEFDKLEAVLPGKKDADSTIVHNHDHDDLKLDFELAKSYIAPRDIAAFVPQLKNLDDRVTIQAQVSGYEHSLNMSNLTVTYGEKLKVVANAEIRDWQDPDNTYLLTAIDELTISGRDIEEIVGSFTNKPMSLPKEISQLNTISFEGDLSGYLHQLTAFGTLVTDNGFVRTDILLGFNKTDRSFSYAKGKIYTTGFELGKLLKNNDLGNTSFSIAVDLNKPHKKELRGTVKGIVYDFDFKGYKYSDVTLDVGYDNKRLEGKLNLDDENGSLNLEGLFDFANKEQPVLNFIARADDIQLGKLNIVKDPGYSLLSFDINANFVGANIDNVNGYISVDSLEFLRDEKRFVLDKFLIEATGLSSEKNRRIEIKSDILNGYVEGEQSLLNIVRSVRHTLHAYLPALMGEKPLRRELKNNFDFHFKVNNSESISDIFKLPVTVYETADIDGYYRNKEDLFKLEIKTPAIKAGGMNIKSGYVVLENPGDSINAVINVLLEGKNQVVNDISINSSAANNSVLTSISLENNSKSRAKGQFNILAEFTQLGKEDGLQTRVSIEKSDLLLNNAKWRLEESTITVDKNLLDVDNFWFYTEDGLQELKINGKYSRSNPAHILKTQLRDIDLRYLFETLAIDALKFGGAASGNLFLSSIEEKPYANTRLAVKNFQFNGTELGDLNLFSELDDETNVVMLDGLITNKENKKTKVSGTIDPINQALSLNFDADSIDVGFLHSYAASVFDKISGRGTGNVHLYGDFSNVTVEGTAFIEKGKIGIKFLNTDYSFSDTVYLRRGLIYFNDIAFKDEYGNTAYGSGKIVHDYFRDMMYHIELEAKDFLVYNATEAHNPLFYGKVFGSGKGILGGDETEVNIDINMQTRENTLVRMNFMEDVVNEYSFITYKEPKGTVEEPEAEEKSKSLRPIKTESGMNINMNFYIDATPDATFELLMDPVGRDILRGSGTGAMQFVWSSRLEPQLFGTFNVNRGSYNFTFQRLMERKFSIQDGSTIQFRGDPFEAILDVNAIYKLSASLSDLDKFLVEQSGQMSIPVHCVLNLSGQLKHPNVGLDIKFPTANADVERQIKSYMDTEDMINRQVTYLLLLSKFYTPVSGNVDHPSSDFASVASATLSSQLSKIVSQVDDRWQLGTHIRVGDADMTSTEVELLLSSQLLNDRLLINGNFGYRDNPYINTNGVVTDVDIEFLLNNSGTWRVKAYNHYNEKFYYQSDLGKGIQTQGVGLMYRRDFDKLSELIPFRRIILKPINKDTLHQVLPDSIQKGSELSNFVKIKKK